MKIESYKKSGRTFYRFRAYIGRDPATGNPLRISRSGFETKKEAELAFAEIRAKAKPGAVRHMTVSQLYDIWLPSYRMAVKESTLRQTTGIFEHHILPVFGGRELADIKPIECQRFMDKMAAEAATGSGRFIYLKKLLDFAVENELLERNPAANVKKPRKRKDGKAHGREVTFYTREQLRDFLGLCREKLPPLWYAFFRLLAYSGMRRGEALALTWSDLEGDAVKVVKTVSRRDGGLFISETPKTDKSNRLIFLDHETAETLRALPHESALIFPNKHGGIMQESQPVKRMHQAVDGSGLPYISPHGLRHTHCSLLFSAGASIPEVQERLGHSDVKTTIEIYNHIYKDDKKRALNRFLEYMEEAAPDA